MHLTNAKFLNFKNAAKLGLSFFSFALFIGMFEFTITLKLDSIDVNVFLIGAFISFSWFITTLFDLYWGTLIDRIGKAKSIIIGCLLFGIFTFSFSLTEDIILLFLFSSLAYIGFDIMYIALEGFLIDNSNKRYFNYSTSGFFPIWSLAYVFGPIIAAVIILEFGINSVFLLSIPMIAIAILFFVLLFKNDFKKKQKDEIEKFDLRKDLTYFKELIKKEYSVLLGIFICTFWHSTMLIGIPIYFAIGEGSILDAALVATAFAFPFIFTDLIDGFIATNRHRRFMIITAGFFVGSISLISFFLTENIVFAMLFAFFSTLGVNLSWATFEIEAGLISKKNTSGKVESFFVFSKNMGWGISPIIFGTIALLFGIKMPFLFTALLLLSIGIYFFIYHAQIK